MWLSHLRTGKMPKTGGTRKLLAMTTRPALLASTAIPIVFASAPPSIGWGADSATGFAPNVEAIKASITQRGAMLQTDEMEKRDDDSEAMVCYWDKVDAILGGIDTMRAAGDKYLPKFEGEPQAKYDARKKLTKMTNVYADIVSTLAAKPFEQECKLIADEDRIIPQELIDFCENIDGAGNNLTMFAKTVFRNGVNYAIDWIYVDYSKREANVRSLADAKAAGERAFWSRVRGPNVTRCTSETINGKQTLTFIRFMEPGKPMRYREFERDASTGAISWRLFKKQDKPSTGNALTEYELEDDGTIAIDQIPLVPFITGLRDGKRWFFRPELQDAVDLQIDLYQSESALKYAKTLTGYPMLTGNGVMPSYEADGKTIKPIIAGPSTTLYAPPSAGGSTAGSWSFIEPAATSMKFLADDIKSTQDQLRELGRQPLTAQSGNLTVVTTAVAASKSRSAVAAWALGLKDTLENAFVLTCKFMGIAIEEYDPQVYVFVDFDDVEDNGPIVTALQTMRGAKDISRETYWKEMQRFNVLSPEFDAEAEEKALLKELPGDGEDKNPDEAQ